MLRLFFVFIFALVVVTPVAAQTVEQELEYVPNEVLVKWANLPGGAADVAVVQVDDVATAVDVLAADPRVEYVEPNYRRFISLVPDDTYYTSGLLTHLEQSNDADIDAATAWNETTGSRNVLVAVLDTGVDIDHPDLAGNIWVNPGEVANNGIDDDNNGYIDDVNGWDFIDNDNNVSPIPDSAVFDETVVLHGTHVAGTIGATGNNVEGVTGINWEVTILPIKVFDDDGNSTIAVIVEAMEYATSLGADVFNMSFGGYSNSQTEAAGIAEVVANGGLVVAAAGNDSLNIDDYPSYPVCYEDVLGVSAVDGDDGMAWFTNYGAGCVDVAAPGQSILSTYYTDDPANGFTSAYGYLSGTSMATPVVSGIAALMLAVDDTLTNGDLLALIVSSTDTIGLPELGSGRVNAAQAVAEVKNFGGPNEVSITGFRSSRKNKTILSTERGNAKRPYFQWHKPNSLASLAGYYVYFGQAKKNPLTHGTFQTKRSYRPATNLKGNERVFRLRIKAVDVDGNASDLSQFVYIVDRKVQRPIWHKAGGLRWYAPKGEYVVGYKVYRATSRTGKYQSISGVITQQQYRDTTAVPGTTYFYKLRAIDDLGNVSTLTGGRMISV